jgi:hypothetical protein
VHEWGGDPVQLRGLLAEVQRAHPAAEILGSPADFAALGLPIDRANEEYLCLAQVVNPARIISAFLPGAARSATGTGDRWDIIVGESEYRGVTTQQLGPLLFGLPGADQGLLLPLWFWGLDGV